MDMLKCELFREVKNLRASKSLYINNKIPVHLK